MNNLAITRAPGASLANCELTYLERRPIDLDLALAQHRRYQETLRSLRWGVIALPPDDALPDSCFVEDTALILPEVAIMANPGVESRRGEIDSMAEALARYRRVERVAESATFDGGDILRVYQTIFVGLAEKQARTNQAGAAEIRRIAEPFGFEVKEVPFGGCLHLQSAVTQVGPRSVLLNPRWVDEAAFRPLDVVHVARDEPNGANTLRVGEAVLMPTSAPATTAKLKQLKYDVRCVDVSEFEKAEAGVTCLSLLI